MPVDGNFFDDLGADSMVMARFCARLRKRDDLPTVSMKDVYAHPTVRSLAAAFAPAAPVARRRPSLRPRPSLRRRPRSGSAGCAGCVGGNPVQTALAAVLAEVLECRAVSVDGNFFDDLGADSMVMARFCARARKRTDLPTVSMKDVYRHPTIRSLAAASPASGAGRASRHRGGC